MTQPAREAVARGVRSEGPPATGPQPERPPSGGEAVATPPPLRQVALPGDRVLTVRPMAPEDGPALIALYTGLSGEDCYLRFFGARPPTGTFVAKMAAVAERGGAGLVAEVRDAAARADGNDGTHGDGGAAARTGQGRRIVAEATYELLPDGDGELGITVAADARGWLGPYLLDTLLEVAAQRGVANLQADVLLANGRMLAMLCRRGMAVIQTDEYPAIVRVVISTTGQLPSWPPRGTGRRVLVEAPGGRWRAERELRKAGYQVMVCPGPPGGWTACPRLRGGTCPLAAGADVLVTAVPGELGRALVDAHLRSGSDAVLCTELAAADADPGPGVRRIPRGAPGTAVVELMGGLASAAGRSALEKDTPPSAQ